MHIIVLPTLNVNDEYATVSWTVSHKSAVLKNQFIATIETTKAVVDLESEAEGFLYQLVSNEEQAKVGQPIAVVHESSNLSETEIQDLITPLLASQKPATAKKWTKRAEILARARGIPIEEISGVGAIIKESDVLSYLDTQQKPAQISQQTSSVLDIIDDVYQVNRQQRVLILGDGLAAVLALDVIGRLPDLRPVGILDDDPNKLGKRVMGVPVIDQIDAASRLWNESAFDAVLCLMPNTREYRCEVFERLQAQSIPFVNVIDPSVSIHSNVQLGQGNLIMANCRLGACTAIGDNNFLSAYINLDHHNRLGSHCTFGPAVSTSGEVIIGDNVKFGTGIFIEPCVTIGDNCLIASGATLVGHVPANSLVKTKINYTIEPLPGQSQTQ